MGILDKVYTLEEAAQLYYISAATLRKNIQRKKYKPYEIRKSGSVWLITKKAMDRLYKNDIKLKPKK